MLFAPDRRGACLSAVIAALVLAGCGFPVASPDVVLLQRTGQGKPLTLLVIDDGTIRCNGGPARPISDSLLIEARDLAANLDNDAKANLRVPPTPNSVYSYSIKVQDGTISFGDTAAANHSELGPAEQFAVHAAEGPCGLSGQ